MRSVKLLLASALLWAGVAQAALVAGTDFLPVAPAVPVDNPKAVEVLEVFWYGCPHCLHLEKGLNAWRARLPKNVVFKRMPVMWGAGHEKHAQVFYTLEAMGQLERLHGKIFEAVQGPNVVELRDENRFFDWAAAQGLNRAQVASVYRSFGVMSQMQRARQLGQAFGVSGVPAFYVQGKYMTSPSLTKSEDRTFQVLDQLVQQELSRLAPAVPAKPVAAAKPAAAAKPVAAR